jgi:hypothetical protein
MRRIAFVLVAIIALAGVVAKDRDYVFTRYAP